MGKGGKQGKGNKEEPTVNKLLQSPSKYLLKKKTHSSLWLLCEIVANVKYV